MRYILGTTDCLTLPIKRNPASLLAARRGFGIIGGAALLLGICLVFYFFCIYRRGRRLVSKIEFLTAFRNVRRRPPAFRNSHYGAIRSDPIPDKSRLIHLIPHCPMIDIN